MLEYRTAQFPARGLGKGGPIAEIDDYINTQISAGWEYVESSYGNGSVLVVMRRLKPPPQPEDAKPKFFHGVEESAQ